MSATRRARRTVLAAMLLAGVMAVAFGAQAQAATYGEESRYALGSKVTLAAETDAFGVDQENNVAFVGYKSGESGKYGLKEVKVNAANKGEVLGTVTFKPPSGTSVGLSEEATGIEGVAVDGERHVVYVLARYEQEAAPKGIGVYVAGALYAFSTIPKAGKLEPAPHTAEGLLANFAALGATSLQPNVALAYPQGITLDPKTHEVIILGEAEEGNYSAANEKRHLALQRVSEQGELGKRYVSAKTVQEEGSSPELADSPVVTTSGRVFFQRGEVSTKNPESLLAAPSSFESSAPPTTVFQFTPFENETITEKLLTFDSPSSGEKLGAALTYAPTAEGEGRFYSAAEIYPYVVKEGHVEEGNGGPYPGALGLSYTEQGETAKVSERGWTGGQAEGICSIGGLGETYAMYAAGKENKLFALSIHKTFPPEEKEEAEVIELGPNGSGCPRAEAAPMRAEVNGKSVATAATGTPVKFSVELTANATSVEWSFADGATQTVTTGEYQTATIKHAFAQAGKYKVTAKIHTDDLTTEEVKGEVELEITGETKPIAPLVTKQPVNASVTEGESASFEAEASGTPAPSVQWEVSTNGGSTFAAVGTGTSGGTTDKLTVSATTSAENSYRYRATFTNSAGSASSGSATLTVNAKPVAPKVTKQPVSVEVTEGEPASFEAEASGTPAPSVQWEVSTDHGASFAAVGAGTSGGTSDKLTVLATTLAQSGYQYRATFTSSAGSAKSATATLTVKAKPVEPTVTKQPANASVLAGESATFEAEASGIPAPSVQWEVSTDKGATFAAVGAGTTGGTSDKLTVSSTTVSENGYQYRARFTNSVKSVTSNAATLTVTTKAVAPMITKQPVSVEVTEGEAASFEAEASGTPTPSVQWEVSTDGGGTFTAVGAGTSGGTSDSLTVTSTKVSESGYKYRAKFTNSAGSVTSATATLTVKIKPVLPNVTKQPVSVAVTEGESASFEAEASGTPAPGVQWEVSTNGGTAWAAVGAGTSGGTTDKLTVSATTPAENGYQYRATFTNSAGSATSSVATLTVNAKPVAPAVTKQPVSVEVTEGESASFEAEASGSPAPGVQWEVSADHGASFSAVGTGTSGGTSDKLTVSTTTLPESGYQYRAKFTNSLGAATSSPATLTVKARPAGAPTLTRSPGDQAVTAGDSASFEAEASGSPTPSVQWEVLTSGGTAWMPVGAGTSGATSNKLTVAPTNTSENGSLYRAKFSNSLGTATSNVATLAVKARTPEAPKLTNSPANHSVKSGESATFEAAASGSPTPSVQWEVSIGGTAWANVGAGTTGGTSDTLTVDSTSTSENGYKYRARFTNASGAIISGEATLTVNSGSLEGFGGVLGITAVAPNATIVSNSTKVSSGGALRIEVGCPAGATSCIGTVTLRTLHAVSAGNHVSRAPLTLARVSFTVAAGQTKMLTLHLSTKARTLLRRQHGRLRARATIVARNPAGEERTGSRVLTLALAKRKH